MLHAHGSRLGMLAVASLLIAATGPTAAFAEGAQRAEVITNVTVTADKLQGWAHQAYDGATPVTPNQQFVAGPGTPPLGGGSLKMTLSGDRVELFRTERYDGTKISDLRTLTYSTYAPVQADGVTPQQPAHLRLSVDTDADGIADDRLSYYPPTGDVVPNKWQTWDAGAGAWTEAGAPGTVTLADYVARSGNADATIVKDEDAAAPSQADGGIAFMVGGPGAPDGDSFINIINIGTVDPADASGELLTRFDLEPAQPRVSIGDAQVTEGNNGAALSFPVTVANPTAKAVRLEYHTVRGTALPDSDYKAVFRAVTIAAGQTTGELVVPVVSDTVNEPTETLTVKATAPGYGIMSDGTATGTIIDDDPVVTPPVVTPPVVTPAAVGADLVVKGSGHKAGKDDILANAIGKAAGAKVKLFRRTKAGTFRKVATGRLNSKGNHRFKNIADKNGNKRTEYKVKISSTDLTKKDQGRIKLR
jgi:hypothetical protein